MYELLTTVGLLAASLQTADLGHPRFHVREAAHDRLTGLLPASLPAVLLATQAGDPEVAWRAKAIVRRNYPGLDLWKCCLNPFMLELMTSDTLPDEGMFGEATVADLWRANNLLVPDQSSWTTPEGECRWVWNACKVRRSPVVPQAMPAGPYFWNMVPMPGE